MNATAKKLTITAIVAVAVIILTPAMGLTQAEADDRSGVVIDFGYWDTVWIPLVFNGMDGYQLLEKACELKGYPLVYQDDEHTIVHSINEQSNLPHAHVGTAGLECILRLVFTYEMSAEFPVQC